MAQLMDFEDRSAGLVEEEMTDPLLSDLCERLRAQRSEIPGVSEEEVDLVLAATASYARAMKLEFGREHDHFRLLGQDNIRRYLRVRDLRIRLHSADNFFDLVARVSAARILGCRVSLSIPPGVSVPGLTWLEQPTEGWAGVVEPVEEDDETLAEVIRTGRTERVRYAAPQRVPREIHAAVKDTGVYVARAPVLAEGRVELLWYLREQSISRDYHRYGNIGERAAWFELA